MDPILKIKFKTNPYYYQIIEVSIEMTIEICALRGTRTHTSEELDP